MATKNFSYDDLLKYVPVSRETYQRLQQYVLLLEKWQKSINLISGTTLKDIWTRHIVDCSQLFSIIQPAETVVDFGSGAGFPGLILSILGKADVTLVESDGRKIAFLKEADRITGAEANIIHSRVETIDINRYSTITARAFAPLSSLLQMTGDALNTGHKLLLLKGKQYMAEISEARKNWTFHHEVYPSKTDSEGVVLLLTNFNRASAL